MSINLRIKELRDQKKMTRKEFSGHLNIDNSQYSKIENGKLTPTLNLIVELCSIFNISSDWLLTGKGEMLKTISLEKVVPKEPINMDETQLLRDMIALLKDSNKNLQTDKEKLEKQIEVLNNKMDRLESKIEELQAENKSLRETAKQQRTVGVA